ncbi:AraC family transcriptional regulator [Paraburkholderia phenoliruptrix]|uniref:AraC family transcriptional regulator n=1 Tax=Paraburkholderia phenoliruptrix TaxID=252970 RepID=UPI001C6E2652|nr:helix-turn-helix transcriptional regulator [Paraburkholderia phenoliruptrix]MBW9102690.1 helix-turn-helix transcriptional regulator [Paraburkholderia phenoliruptrix]MBW9128973.1 helix-turn-helix transcriptional regulator [Paraburkholderia ginsengiterrae]
MERFTRETSQKGKGRTGFHRHPEGQLICIVTGRLQIQTEVGAWLLPPRRAIWIPPNLMHTGDLRGVKAWSHILLSPNRCRLLPERPQVIAVGSLLEALIQRVAPWDHTVARTPEEARIVSVMIDEIRAAKHEPLHLPLPGDKRLLKMVDIVLNDLSREHSLEALSSMAGLSARTARRLFAASLGISLAEWRQQALLLRAIDLLAQGESVSAVADVLGYASPSSFIAMFRIAFGVTPGKYVKADGHDA